MTEKEMQEAANKLATINAARESYDRIKGQLEYVNKKAKAGKLYQVPVDLADGDSYRRSTVIYILLDAGVVQQSLINEMQRCARVIIKNGGSLSNGR